LKIFKITFYIIVAKVYRGKRKSSAHDKNNKT